MSKPLIVTLTGPTCSGKSTLEGKLVRDHGFSSVRSFTTRPMRDGEVNGREYDFVTRDWVLQQEAAGQLVEFVEFAGHLYGATVAAVADAAAGGKPVVIVVDPHGAKQFKRQAARQGWTVVSVFIDIDLPLIFERFIARAIADKKCDPQNYARRLQKILDDEVSWVVQGWDLLVTATFLSDAVSAQSVLIDFIKRKAHAVG